MVLHPDGCKPFRVLVSRRADSAAVLAGYWEFPGGKLERDESITDAVRREAREELGIAIEPVRPLAPIEHGYPHGRVRLEPWVCRLLHGSAPPRAVQVAEVRWVTASELLALRFPEANGGLIEEVVAELG